MIPLNTSIGQKMKRMPVTVALPVVPVTVEIGRPIVSTEPVSRIAGKTVLKSFQARTVAAGKRVILAPGGTGGAVLPAGARIATGVGYRVGMVGGRPMISLAPVREIVVPVASFTAHFGRIVDPDYGGIAVEWRIFNATPSSGWSLVIVFGATEVFNDGITLSGGEAVGRVPPNYPDYLPVSGYEGSILCVASWFHNNNLVAQRSRQFDP